LKQLNQLRAQGGAGVPPAAPAGTPVAAPAAKAPAKSHTTHPALAAPVAPAPAVTASADLPELWARLIEAVGRVSQFTRTYLLDAHPISFALGVLTIGFDPEFEDHLGLVDNARNHTLLQTKLTELGHPNTQIKFIKAEAPAGQAAGTATPTPAVAAASTVAAPAAAASKPGESGTGAKHAKEKPAPVTFNKSDFKNDPLIQKALEIFKGQIVEVRA